MDNLPRGLRIDHGYVQVRLQHKGRTYCKNFGPDCTYARQLATIHLSKKREEILLGRFGYGKEVASKCFRDVADIFFDIWSRETDASGAQKHNADSCAEVRRVLDKNLVPFFGRMVYDGIQPVDVQRWRDARVKVVLGTSANREQALLSSLFSHIEMWVKSEYIKTAFKLPVENPCQYIEKAPTTKRDRILTILELKALKSACLEAHDNDLWEICAMAVNCMLRKKDLFRIEKGIDIDLIQAKTQRRIELPLQVLRPLQYGNFRKRWESARKAARLIDVQFRDLRKTGAHLLKGMNVSNKLISEALGHSTTKTTETYLIKDSEQLREPLKALSKIVEEL